MCDTSPRLIELKGPLDESWNSSDQSDVFLNTLFLLPTNPNQVSRPLAGKKCKFLTFCSEKLVRLLIVFGTIQYDWVKLLIFRVELQKVVNRKISFTTRNITLKDN